MLESTLGKFAESGKAALYWYLPRAAAATSSAVLAAEVVASRKLEDRVVVSSENLQYTVFVTDKSLELK
jgi:hypothetical protein